MDVFSLVATLELKADSFFSGLADAAEAMLQFASESVQTSMEFDSSMSHVRAISGQVTGTVEQQEKYMSQLISTAKEMGLQFEYGADNTATAMNIINAKSAALGRSTQFTASEVADAFGYMSMAGWDYKDMLGGIDGVVSLAAASGEDLARTSGIVTDALTAFGMQASEAVDFADLLAVTAAKANTNVSMMGESFKYVAPIAGAYGIEAEDIAEALGLMANNGIKASQAGTALRRILSNIAVNNGGSDTSSGALDYVKMLGVDFYDAHGRVRDLSEFFDDLRNAWEKMDGAEELKAIYAKEIAGQYGMSAFLALMNSTDEDVLALQEGLQNRAGASAEMMGIMIDNLEGDITIFKSAYDALQRTVGEELTPMLRDFTQYGTESLDTLLLAYGEGGLDALPESLGEVIRKGADKINEYLPEWKENGTKIMETISAGIREAAPVLGEVIGTFGDLIGGFLSENAGVITQTVATFVKSITPGIIALAKGVISGLKDAWPEIWDGVKEIGGGLLSDLIDMVAGDNKFLSIMLKNVLGLNEQVNNGLKEAAKAQQEAEEALNNLDQTHTLTIETTLIDGISEPAETAIEALWRLYDQAGENYDSYSWHDDNTTEAATTALAALIQLADHDGDGYVTSSDHIDGTSDPAYEAYQMLMQLFTTDGEGNYTFSEHDASKAISVIANVIDLINELMAEDGYTSHTQSIHDEITNVITNYVTGNNLTLGTTETVGSDGTVEVITPVKGKKGTSMATLNARSMSGGTILRGATLFGWDAQGVPQIGGGEGPEAVVGVGSLNQQIREAVQDGLSGIVGAIAQAIGGRDEQPIYVVLDTGELVGAIGGKMDAELGKIVDWKGGGRA